MALPRLFVPSWNQSSELGYAERTSNDTTTNATFGNVGSNKISGLSVTVVGEGKPVMVEFYCSSAIHSVTDTAAGVVLLINGATTGGQQGYVEAKTSEALIMRRRLVLTAGTSYTFEIGKFIVAAGTGTYLAGADNPMHLSVNR